MQKHTYYNNLLTKKILNSAAFKKVNYNFWSMPGDKVRLTISMYYDESTVFVSKDILTEIQERLEKDFSLKENDRMDLPEDFFPLKFIRFVYKLDHDVADILFTYLSILKEWRF